MAVQIQTTAYSVIYIYSRKEILDALKIGKTTINSPSADGLVPNCEALNEAARNRIDQETVTAGVAYDLLYTELAWYIGQDGQQYGFDDHAVHDVLLNSGYEKKEFPELSGMPNEWFKVNIETAIKAIAAVKAEKNTIAGPPRIKQEHPTIIFREEQEAAIETTRVHFNDGKKMLWNAKMRFGKTLCALELIRREQYGRVLILTHRPVVKEGWFDDFHCLDFENYQYGYRKTDREKDDPEAKDFNTLKADYEGKGIKYIYFASMQDLRGSKDVATRAKNKYKGISKNHEIFRNDWDLIILDEAHEGTQTLLGKAVIEQLKENRNPFMLYLSGTPFNILDQFSEEEIYTWDYVMEQRAKEDWPKRHPDESNPYEGLARLNIYTYNLGDVFKDNNLSKSDDDYFNFAEFFRVWTDENEEKKEIPVGAGVGDFVHADKVKDFLDLLCKEDPDSNYPFSNDKFRTALSHTLWMVPGVKQAAALEKLLNQHPLCTRMGFHVVNVAGDGSQLEDLDPDNAEAKEKIEKNALDRVNAAVENYARTITLSCGRLTTGVSVWQWTGIFMLSGGYSTGAANYMQTIFRGQTPNKDGSIKTNCYAFDFAPDRTLTVINDYLDMQRSSSNSPAEKHHRNVVTEDFLRFCPVISMSGSKEIAYDALTFVEQVNRAYTDHVIAHGFKGKALVRNYAEFTQEDFMLLENIGKLLNNGKVKLSNDGTIDLADGDLKGKGSGTKINKGSKSNRSAGSQTTSAKSPQDELTKKRRKAQSVFDQIFVRLPLLLFGTVDDVTGLTLDDLLSNEVIDDESWAEFMPERFTKQIMRQLEHLIRVDVLFSSASRIIKEAHEADSLPVEERVAKISEMLKRFHYPDRETVLTPWRVVNMHMSDTVGGYDFYDENNQTPLRNPRWVDRGEVTRHIFCKPESRVLEINSKSGVYPLYITYSLYRKQLESSLFADTDEAQRQVWNGVLKNNVFVLCKTKMAQKITQRVLAGYSGQTTHCKYYPHLVDILRGGENKQRYQKLIQKLSSANFWDMNKDKDFNFDAIIGNPPYQMMDGGNNASAIPIYNKFVDLAKVIRPNYVSMIMPAKWYNGGRGLNEFRQSMLADKSLQCLFDFVDGHECFPTVDIAGGVCYFLWNREHQGLCKVTTHYNGEVSSVERNLNDTDVFIRHKEEISILNKVSKEKVYLNIYPQKPFGLRTYIKPTENGDINLRYIGGIGKFKSEEVSLNANLINKWKVISSALTAEHAGETDKNGQKRIISTIEILPPGTICTETYLLLSVFDSEKEAQNFMGYMKTRFVRCLIAMVTATQHLARPNFRYVPLQDFTRPWSDAELYAKYGLTEEEQAFIEQCIKPME